MKKVNKKYPKQTKDKENIPFKYKPYPFKTIPQKQQSTKFLYSKSINKNQREKQVRSELKNISSKKLHGKKQTLRFPPIKANIRQNAFARSPRQGKGLSSQKQAQSMKRIHTENSHFSEVKSGGHNQESIRDVLMKIMDSKQSKYELSIDEEISKLENLTKRYSHLRKDLVSIQEDILTMSFKKMFRKEDQDIKGSTTTFQDAF